MLFMNEMHIKNIDLNLLTVFDAVMAEGSITRAAARIGLTQPAVSHALNRLRTLFDDALFVRSPRGMEPTPLARRMAASIRHALAQVEELLRLDRDFDPRGSTRCFEIGMSDYASVVLLPPVLRLLAAEAPGIRIVVKSVGHATGFGMLEEGGVELIAGNFPDAPAHLRTELLFMENFVCAARKGHAAFGRKLTMKRYLLSGHLQVSTSGSPHGYVDAVLDRMQTRRDVRVTVGHFLAAPLILGATELVATEPRRLFGAMGSLLELDYAKVPFVVPDFRVTMDWHGRNDSDPGHRWLRDIFRRAVV